MILCQCVDSSSSNYLFQHLDIEHETSYFFEFLVAQHLDIENNRLLCGFSENFSYRISKT